MAADGGEASHCRDKWDAMADCKLIRAVEAYFTDLRLVRGAGGVTDERSLCVPLANLLNAVRDAETEGVLRSVTGRPGRRPPQLRSLCESTRVEREPRVG